MPITLNNRGNKATKTGFGEGLLRAGELDPRIIALGADITASVGVNLFAERFPDRFFSLGIAEQNCVAVAAGLALGGKIPVFATYGVFSALRSADQIRVSVCYNNLHVIIGGAHAGVSVGPDGATHQALEDLAIMRVLPNMTVLSPCDATQTKLAVQAALIQCKGPVYIRFGREPRPDFTHEEMGFRIEKAQELNPGMDITVIATGHMVWEALQAAYEMKQKGITIRVINVHTIKPLDEETIIRAAKETNAVITAEEHQVAGGLGGSVAELLSRHCPVPMDFIGMNNSFGESGQPEELMAKYKMNAAAIQMAVIGLLQRKHEST